MALPLRLLRRPTRALNPSILSTSIPKVAVSYPIRCYASQDPTSAKEKDLDMFDANDADVQEELSGYIFGEVQEESDLEDFEFDDLTSLGHSNLEMHREARQYARIAAYEMPLLSKLAKPFEPPTKDQVLRYRYTSYMGEKHPAEKKVVVMAKVEDLVGKGKEYEKFLKIAGPRVNGKGELRMSCEMFDTQAQNKRYLSDLVDKLIAEAKNTSDMFEDIPLDKRHIKPKRRDVKAKFPESWKMTPERAKALERERLIKMGYDPDKKSGVQWVDGRLVDTEQQVQAPQGQVPPVAPSQL